jgi:hypothetical protein
MPLMQQYGLTVPNWRHAEAAGRYLGEIHGQPAYQTARMNVPADSPDVVYAAVRFGGIDGKYFVSQLYDPYYYLPAGYDYGSHRDVAGRLTQCWLTQSQTRLWLVDARNSRNYADFIADHGDWFTAVGEVPVYGWGVWDVHVPVLSADECRQASREATS